MNRRIALTKLTEAFPTTVEAERNAFARARTLTPGELTAAAGTSDAPVIHRSGFQLSDVLHPRR